MFHHLYLIILHATSGKELFPKYPHLFRQIQFTPIDPPYVQSLNLSTPSMIEKLKTLYCAELRKISKKEFFDNFMKEIEKELKEHQYCLYKAAPYFKTFSTDVYYKNQDLIHKYLKNIGQD